LCSAFGRPAVSEGRDVQDGPGGLRGNHEPHPRLDGPRELHLWGDGSGAVLLRAYPSNGNEGPLRDGGKTVAEILSVHIHTDGANGENLLLPGGGSKTTPISHESVDKKLHTLRMIRANESVRVAVKRFADAAEEAASVNGIRVSDAKWVIPHQANARMLQQVAKRLDIPWRRSISRSRSTATSPPPPFRSLSMKRSVPGRLREGSYHSHGFWRWPHLGQQPDSLVRQEGGCNHRAVFPLGKSKVDPGNEVRRVLSGPVQVRREDRTDSDSRAAGFGWMGMGLANPALSAGTSTLLDLYEPFVTKMSDMG